MKIYKIDEQHFYCIDYDQMPENPRNNDNLGHMITYNKRYSPDDYDFDFVDKIRELYGDTHIDSNTNKVRVNGENYVVLPIYIYEHGYTAYSTRSFLGRALHAEWDSGIAGIIYASGDEIKKFYDCKNLTKKVIDNVAIEFEWECNDFTSYVNGECYVWKKLSFVDGFLECEDVCGGYFNVESILSELDISDDGEEFLDMQSFELELHRRANMKKLTE